MGTGYVRVDVSNNIAAGNVVNASDLDGEFDGVQSAFNSTSGHTHDGTTGEGAPVGVVGPVQDYVAGASSFTPKTDSVYDLGTTSVRWATGFLDTLTLTNALAVANGGTASTTASGARTALGLAIGTDVQAWDANLDQVAALAVTDSNFIVGNGSAWVAETGATARTSLGLGSIATQAASSVAITGGTITGITNLTATGGAITGITDITVADGGTGSSTAAGARTNLGVAIGSDVQAWDANLDQIAALAVTDSNFIVGNGSAWVAETGATVRTSLGLGSIATQAASSVAITGGTVTGITNLEVSGDTTITSTAPTLELSDSDVSDIMQLRQDGVDLIADVDPNNVSAGTSRFYVKIDGSNRIILSPTELQLNQTGSIRIPKGTTAQRPSGVAGDTRFNSDLDRFEGYTTAKGWSYIGGAQEFIESQDASASASLDFTGFDATKYDNYVFEFTSVVPASSTTDFSVQLSTNGGSTWLTGGSDYAYHIRRDIMTLFDDDSKSGDSSNTSILIATDCSATAARGFSGTLKVYSAAIAAGDTRVTWDAGYGRSGGTQAHVIGGGRANSAAVHNAIRFIQSAGNLTSGTITMYGLRNS